MRIRIRYAKKEALQFTSALDIQKIWLRSFRRAKIGLEYTQGFHPHPKMQLALPLALGFTSRSEIMDMWISGKMDVDLIKEYLKEKIPNGLDILDIEIISNSEKALVNRIESVKYNVHLHKGKYSTKVIQSKIESLLNKTEIIRTRRNKQYNLRPLINDIYINKKTKDEQVLTMSLKSLAGKTGRPDEVVDELKIDLTDCWIERIAINYRAL